MHTPTHIHTYTATQRGGGGGAIDPHRQTSRRTTQIHHQRNACARDADQEQTHTHIHSHTHEHTPIYKYA